MDVPIPGMPRSVGFTAQTGARWLRPLAARQKSVAFRIKLWYNIPNVCLKEVGALAKRMVAGVLCAVMLLSLLFMAVRAEGISEAKRVGDEAVSIYQQCLASTGKESLNGYCGLMTSHQLYHMGINKYLLVNDGNKQFDCYRDMDITTGGYYPRAISAEQGDLVYALNEISRFGTRDVYNILVGFQWTDTEAGGTYGHACVINAILDGVVYYVEGFYTPYAGEGGNLGRCTIEQFASQFASWTLYEGIIYFTKDYAESCQSYGTDLFVRTRFDATLRSQPCTPGNAGCEVLRTVAACEVLRVTGVVKNREGEYFYRVEEDGKTSYIYANATSLLGANAQDLAVECIQIPQSVLTGQNIALAGTVKAQQGLVGDLRVKVLSDQGQTALDELCIVDDISCNLQELNERLDTSGLNPGSYTVEISGHTASACVVDGELSYVHAPRVLYTGELTVGKQVRVAARMTHAMEEESHEDGWTVRDGEVFYYKDGKAVTGWHQEFGVKYYFTESGAAAQGETEVEGKTYRFSQTGKLLKEIFKEVKTKTAVK